MPRKKRDKEITVVGDRLDELYNNTDHTQHVIIDYLQDIEVRMDTLEGLMKEMLAKYQMEQEMNQRIMDSVQLSSLRVKR